MSASDAIIRALGADPAVYRPVERAQSRIVSRRMPLGRRPKRVSLKGITPFQFRCFSFALVSAFMTQLIVSATSPILGVAMVLTGGAGLLVLDLLLYKIDILTNADEYQVIAAHPHDAWSVIVAKLVVIGRSTAVMSACIFVIPAIGAGIAFHSVAVGAAFAVAAAALSAFVSVGGMMATAALVAAGGRTALMRFLPIFHLSYLGIYLGAFMGRDALLRVSLPRIESLGWLQWALPTLWFAAPVEAAAGQAGPAVIARGSLALGSFVVLGPISARWIRTRFDERILEPTLRSRPRVSVRGRAKTAGQTAARGPLSDWTLGIRVFWRLFLAHMRSDTVVRSGVLMAFVMPLFILTPSLLSGNHVAVRFDGIMIGILTVVTLVQTFLIRSTTMSATPAAIWFILAAPRAREPYAAAVTRLIRLGIVLPIVGAAAIYSVLAGTGPLMIRVEFAVLVAFLADSMLLVIRVLNPYLPFSQPLRSKRPFRWSFLAIGALMLLGYALFIGGFLALEHWYPTACFIPVVYAAAARVPLGFWAKRRMRRAALSAEMA